MDIKRTDFYNELSELERKDFFYVKFDKYLPAIDNIYYTAFIEDDYNDNPLLHEFFTVLDELKMQAVSAHEPQPFGDSLVVQPYGSQGHVSYKYCISMPDLYDIFILDYLPNDTTPRIQVQLRAFGLWDSGTDKMLIDSYNQVASLFSNLGLTISKCRENRIDYCYHTNAIFAPEKTFSDKSLNKYMSTTMSIYHKVGHIDDTSENNKLRLEYLSLGQRKSNNVFIRIYNKALEVVDKSRKGFFFELWHKNGIISFYDKYCLGFAFAHKDYKTIEKAKLYFYLEYGKDDNVKKEFKLALTDSKTTYHQFRQLAARYMPEVTTVMNIEYQTKRKFYYYSDDFIQGLNFIQREEGCAHQLTRIFKIIDNRAIFLDYLTSATLSFKKPNGAYAAWWERLRNTKLDGLNQDSRLLREYGAELDKMAVNVRVINSVATSATYDGNIDTDFIEDISDFLSNINDNDKISFKPYINDLEFKEWYEKEHKISPEDSSWFKESDFNSIILSGYMNKKIKKNLLLKNRKSKGTDEIRKEGI